MEPVVLHGSSFYCGDCIAGARQHIPGGTVDLIITDPPYGIRGDALHKHYNRNERYVVGGYVEIPEEEYGAFSRRWITEAERILRPGGSLYVVSGYTNLHHILTALKGASLREVNHLIWKYNFGVFTRRKFVSSHYHILYYEKPGGTRTFNCESRFGLSETAPDGTSVNYADREDVWVINREYKPGTVKNKNELPLALLMKILQYSSNAGDLICDLFMGGFSTARAAIGMQRRFVGFEVSAPIFAAKVREMEAWEPGCLTRQIRAPNSGIIRNQGQRWNDDERLRLADRFFGLTAAGCTKKDAVAVLCGEFGRGRWAIEKALKRRADSDERAPE
jgi:site-specific DNA-methyltransferase (adenine-specific)